MVNSQRNRLQVLKAYFLTGLRYISRRPLLSRYHLPVLLTILGFRGKGVEIGVLHGDYSESIIKHGKLSAIYLVDSWKHFPDGEYFDMQNVSQAEQDERYRMVLERFKEHGDRVKVMRMLSCEAVKSFNSGDLDLVYIDANHGYSECKKDLEAWWPKLKKGGVFAGHDYADNREWGCEVKRAVDEFIKKYQQKVFVIADEFPTWYLIKRV